MPPPRSKLGLPPLSVVVPSTPASDEVGSTAPIELDVPSPALEDVLALLSLADVDPSSAVAGGSLLQPSHNVPSKVIDFRIPPEDLRRRRLITTTGERWARP